MLITETPIKTNAMSHSLSLIHKKHSSKEKKQKKEDTVTKIRLCSDKTLALKGNRARQFHK